MKRRAKEVSDFMIRIYSNSRMQQREMASGLHFVTGEEAWPGSHSLSYVTTPKEMVVQAQ